jgi:hypothetical protein
VPHVISEAKARTAAHGGEEARGGGGGAWPEQEGGHSD